MYDIYIIYIYDIFLQGQFFMIANIDNMALKKGYFSF